MGGRAVSITSPFPPRPPTPKELKRNLGALKKAVLRNPTDLDARLRIARTYRLLDKPPDAIEHYRSVARYLANAGQPVLAMAVAKELLQVQPDHQETLLFLARLYARTPAANPSGRVAVPSASQEQDTASAGLLKEWPRTHTGVWRAIQPEDASLMTALQVAQEGGQTSAPGTFAALLQAAAPAPPAQVDPAEDGALALDPSDVLDEVEAPAGEDPDHHHEVSPEDVHAQEDALPDAPHTEPADEVHDGDIVEVAEDSADNAPVPPLPEGPLEPLPVLPNIPLFSALTPEQFVELSRALTHKTAQAGTMVWKEGDDAFFLVVLAAGEAVSFKGDGGSRVELTRVKPGDVAGVFALVSDRRRQASLQASSDVAYFELHRNVLERLARENAGLADALQVFFRERVLFSALATLPIFRDMDPETRQDVAGRFKQKRYQDGDELFYEGAEMSGLWVILEGTVVLGGEHAGEGETFDVRHTLPAGHFLGALAGPGLGATEFSAQAKGSVLAAVLHHKSLQELVAAHPSLRDLEGAARVGGLVLGRHILGGSAQLPADLSPAFLGPR